MTNELSRIQGALCGEAWAITEEGLAQVLAVVERANTEDLEALEMRLGSPLQNTREVTMRDGTAIIPVRGPLVRRAGMLTRVSGATSVDELALDFQAALDDPQVERVLLDLDSPGGMISGIAQLAEHIHAATKPTIAYAGDMAASAAYWLAAATDRVLVGPTAEVGSVGVVLRVRRNRDDGHLEVVSQVSPAKRPDVDTPEGRAQFQRRADAVATVFVESVAAYRGVSVDTVLERFGAGDILVGQAAVDAGLADGVSSLEAIIADRPGVPAGGAASSRPGAGASTPTRAGATTKPRAPEQKEETSMSTENMPLEQRARQAWDADADLRSEFGGDGEDSWQRYLAYRKAVASGQARSTVDRPGG